MRNRITYLLACLIVSGSSLAQSVYKDNSYRPAERAEDLVKQLTLEEKVSLMMDNSKPVERLGIKPYNWWNEALHGVARSGLATVFPQPIGILSLPKLYIQLSLPYPTKHAPRMPSTRKRAATNAIKG